MINSQAFAAAMESRDVDITRIEFEVLDNDTLRWLLWDGRKRLYWQTLDRPGLIEAMQLSCVLLRMMTLALQSDNHAEPSA
jgi:hypothetical protein